MISQAVGGTTVHLGTARFRLALEEPHHRRYSDLDPRLAFLLLFDLERDSYVSCQCCTPYWGDFSVRVWSIHLMPHFAGIVVPAVLPPLASSFCGSLCGAELPSLIMHAIVLAQRLRQA